MWSSEVLGCSGLFTLISELSGTGSDWHRALHDLLLRMAPLQPATEALQFMSSPLCYRSTNFSLTGN